MNFLPCTTPLEAIVHDGKDEPWYGVRPVGYLKGDASQWGVLEQCLKEYASPFPQGALVGAWGYDGSFEFIVFEQLVRAPLVPAPVALARTGEGFSSMAQWQEFPTADAYRSMVRQAQEYIASGDIYQVNLARRLSREVKDFDPLKFYQHLWHTSKARYSAYMQFAERALMSASPELFLCIQDRTITTQPIKGTRPRACSPLKDALLAKELARNPKEVAELIMITDLERNDLGQVCETGSVQVTELVQQMALSHVHHQYSTVQGRLRQDVTPLQAVRACFPGGSITGAPKKRAMEIIAELEPFERGFYTGAIGFLKFNGEACFNIAIRTAEYHNDLLTFYVGSGITADSQPQEEYEETEHKSRNMKDAYSAYCGSLTASECAV